MSKEGTASRRFKTLAVAAAAAADEKKGEDILLLNIRTVSSLADYLLLVSVQSPAHLEAVQEKIEAALKSEGLYASHRDGRRSGLWRVLDFGALMVHLMHPEAREFYGLDRLYRGARKVAWGNGRTADA